MTESKSSRDITDYLRGLGVIAVLITHYSGMYDSDFYSHYLSNYGNAFMAIFFILAGYGGFFSFEKRFAAHNTSFRVIAKYLLDRVLRIYPLYWVALLLTAFIEPQYFPVGDMSIAQLLAVVAALPVVTTPLWFISSIIQCYIFAPFLYMILKKIRVRKFILFNLALGAVLLLVSQDYMEFVGRLQRLTSWTIPDPNVILYRGIFLGNVLLFSLGLMTPGLIREYGERMRSWVVFLVSAGSLLGLSFILRYDVLVLQRGQLIAEVGYYSSVFFFCWSTVVVKPMLPMKGLIGLMGRYSYSLYLFHALLFQILIMVNLFQKRLPLSLAIVFLLFPPLIWFCIVSEKGARAFRNRVWRFARRKIAPAEAGSEPIAS
ncbi:MAG: acyltransferase [Actinobacteria bacterium]|nr:acyltransferase [Actinomycetota bacterium]MCL5882578.1 acyltransferase [Actinomycetota bacterium]